MAYAFWLYDLCDTYLELIKPVVGDMSEGNKKVRKRSGTVFFLPISLFVQYCCCIFFFPQTVWSDDPDLAWSRACLSSPCQGIPGVFDVDVCASNGRGSYRHVDCTCAEEPRDRHLSPPISSPHAVEYSH